MGTHGRTARGDLRRGDALVIDLAVVAQDPNFGGGARAHLEAFVHAARELDREPEVLYVPHPTLRPDVHASPLERIEALRVLRGSRALVPRIREARDVWVVATVASHGLAAARSGRPYKCWLATSLASENRGRAPGLRVSRRVALHVNAPSLRRLEREVLARADALFAISKSSAAEVAEAAGVPAGNVGVIPIPVDTDHFAPEPDNVWVNRLARPIIAFIGRSDDPRKNVDLLLAAAPVIRQSLPNASILLVGSPPARAVPAGVSVAGPVADLPLVLRQASLFVLPSLQEGFGIVAAEALATGVPVVATRSGGPEELVNNSGGGILLDGFTPEELATRVVELLSDADGLLERRKLGRAYVEREHASERTRVALAAAGVGRDATPD
jgi:glycosyltransferase involved in cell wall biosynthesis